jgi:excisionase family DNA binding protein
MTQVLLSVADFCDRYRVGKATVYRLVAAGHLTLLKLGRRSRIHVEDAERWLASVTGKGRADGGAQ